MGNNNNGIQLFSNPAFGNVRVVMRDDNPWFVAKDVAACIEHSDTSAMCKLCRDKDKVVASARDFDSDDLSESGNSRITLISESGLYRILAKCNLPKCEPFESWVFDEVLPSIRKSGVYATDNFIQKTIDDPDWAISILQQIKFEREQKELALRQRDEAIRTKAWIGSKRESTCMNEVKRFKGENKRLSSENEDLRVQVGDGKECKAAKCIPWLRDIFVYANDKQWNTLLGQIGKQLKRICLSNGFKIIRIPDSNHYEINAYDIRAIEVFKARLISDPNYMYQYRL